MDEDTNQKILNLLDDALKEGPWDKTLFLRAAGKKLREIRDHFAQQVGLDETTIQQQTPQEAIVEPGTIEVYILIYSTDGNNIKRWQTLLSSLESYGIGRAIYRNENDIKKIIRSKDNKYNDAYACVRIKESDILPSEPGKEPKDRFGNLLVTLHERAIQLKNLTRFVHISGIYRLRNNTLEKIADAGLHSWQ